MTMDDIFNEGDKFRGYVVERLLGKGGLGAVYLVRHDVLDKQFALKILFPSVAETRPEYVRRFVREAKIASKIRHPNLVQVYDAGYDNPSGLYFIVMDYVKGCNLRMAIAMGGAMEVREAVRIVTAVAGALAAGEPWGVVHRDIKPENIMMDSDGNVKLVDLGVAKAQGADSLVTMPQSIFGTPGYISPEQAQDSSKVDFRADVYSLGVVLFELLCGERPYPSDNPVKLMEFLLSPDPVKDVCEVNPAVPRKLSMIVKMMCAKKLAERIASASVVLDTLERFGFGKSFIDEAHKAAGPHDAGAFDYNSYMSKPANDTLSLGQGETADTDVDYFIKRLKRKRRMRKMAVALFSTVVLAVLAALAIVWSRGI